MSHVSKQILKTLAGMPLDERYGFPLLDEIRKHCWRCWLLSIGGMYVKLHEMEDAGLVKHEWGEPLPERGNRPRKYWTLLEYRDA